MVLRFYETQLRGRGWQLSGRPLEEDFTRDKALVALDFFLMPAPGKPLGRSYSMTVDYRGASRG